MKLIFSQSFSDLHVSYNKLMMGYRDILARTNVFTRRNMLSQIQNVSIVISSNPIINERLSFQMYETFLMLTRSVQSTP